MIHILSKRPVLLWADVFLDSICQPLCYKLSHFALLVDLGVAKTTVMRLLQMDPIGLGLSTMTTTLLCERALELGSIHWHKLASLPVNEYCALQWIAELALFVLY